MGHYIVDFYCKELSLVIEVDGGSHLLEAVSIKDAKRQKILEKMGLSFLRFTEKEVRFHRKMVLSCIECFILEFEEIKIKESPCQRAIRHTPLNKGEGA